MSRSRSPICATTWMFACAWLPRTPNSFCAQRVVHETLVDGLLKPMLAFLRGIESVLDAGALAIFSFDELEQVLCAQAFQSWSLAGSWPSSGELDLPERKLAELREACHEDHNYTADHTAVQSLYQILSSYNREHQRAPVLRHGVSQPSR